MMGREQLGIIREGCKSVVKLVAGRGVRSSYSQFGEDAFIQWLLKRSTTKLYVDVGAYHPTLYSNTYALYRSGWRGIAIDPNGSLAPLYTLLRPRDQFVRAAIGPKGAQTYFEFSDGAYNTFDADAAEERRKLRWLTVVRQTEVAFRPLSDILAEHGVSRIGFLNIDVEGFDLQVLQSHDWKIRPEVIAIEDEDFDVEHPHTSAIYSSLRDLRYSLVGFCGLTLMFKAE